MIIDFHSHWWPTDEFVHSKKSWDLFVNGVYDSFYKTAGSDITGKELKELFFDPDGSKMLSRMEEAGVDKTVLLPLDWGNVFGEPEMDIVDQNRVYSELQAKYPDKIISFFSIEPRRENADQYFLKAVKDWGMKGLKLYPPTGFFPYDDCCTSLYKICLDNGLPVVFHGSSSSMASTQYCRPEYFKKLSGKFPGLKIVIAHAGGEWVKEVIDVCFEQENVYMDISGWQLSGNTEILKKTMEGILFPMIKSFEKVLFGTDSPIFNGLMKVKDMVSTIQQLEIPEKERFNLLGNAAQNLLG